MQFRSFARHVFDKVVFLAHILCKIVKLQAAVLVELDELIIAGPHSSGWAAALVTIVRIMPENRPAVERLFAFQ